VKLVRDFETERFRGFGYVEFASSDDAQRALEKHGMVSAPLPFFSQAPHPAPPLPKLKSHLVLVCCRFHHMRHLY